MGTVLLTGACGGMGRAICAMLLEKGYTVYGLDRKGCTPVDGVCFVECDVTVPAAIDAAFARIQAEAGHLDAIVHTAGIYDLDSLLEMDEVRFTRMFEVNFFGVYRVNRAFAPLLSGSGRIVITSSELAPLDPLPFTGVYAVTKAALEKYAYSLRMEVGLLGISVSVIRPGAVKTGLLGDSTRARPLLRNHTALPLQRTAVQKNRQQCGDQQRRAGGHCKYRLQSAYRPQAGVRLQRQPQSPAAAFEPAA